MQGDVVWPRMSGNDKKAISMHGQRMLLCEKGLAGEPLADSKHGMCTKAAAETHHEKLSNCFCVLGHERCCCTVVRHGSKHTRLQGRFFPQSSGGRRRQ